MQPEWSNLGQKKSLMSRTLCLACQLWAPDVLCDNCLNEFFVTYSRCTICALPLMAQLAGHCDCTDWKHSPNNSHALLNYSYPWNQLISQFKYQRNVNLAPFFGRLLLQNNSIKAQLEQADFVLPVPLSKKRIQQRGYNQSFELAKKMAPQKSHPDIILRTHHVAAQATLNREQRLKNLTHVFQLDPFKTRLIRQKKIVLVDDVLTTGATIQAVCAALQNADVAEISVVVLARTLTIQQEALLSLVATK